MITDRKLYTNIKYKRQHSHNFWWSNLRKRRRRRRSKNEQKKKKNNKIVKLLLYILLLYASYHNISFDFQFDFWLYSKNIKEIFWSNKAYIFNLILTTSKFPFKTKSTSKILTNFLLYFETDEIYIILRWNGSIEKDRTPTVVLSEHMIVYCIFLN